MPGRASRQRSTDSHWKDSALYLRKNLGSILPRALHDVCQARPADPIEYLAKCLYKAADSDLYFQDKAVFEREKRKMEVKMKTEDTRRQNAIERYKKHIDDLKGYLQREEAKLKPPMEEHTKHAARRQRYQTANGRTESRATKSMFEDYLSEPLSEPSSSRHDSASLSSMASPKPKPGASRRESAAAPPKKPQPRKSSRRPSIAKPESRKSVQLPPETATTSEGETSVKKTSVVGTPRLKHSPGRKGSSPSTETRSAVSVHKESLPTSRAVHEDELERTPTTVTSSSKTISRLFSMAQEVITLPHERGTKSKQAKQKIKKPRADSHTSQQSKIDKDKSETEAVHVPSTLSKKMTWKDSLSDEFSSYMSLEERDETTPVRSTSMLLKRSSREIKVTTEEAKQDESDISVSDASGIEEMHESQKESEESVASLTDKLMTIAVDEIGEDTQRVTIESDLISLGGETVSFSQASSIASVLDEKIDQSFDDVEVKDSRLGIDSTDVISAEHFIGGDEEDQVVRKEHRKKTRKLKVKKQISKVVSIIDTSTEVKSPTLSVELVQRGAESVHKKRKKKRIKTSIVQSAAEEEMEYVEEIEETRIPTMERLSSNVELYIAADEISEELVEEEQQVVTAVKKRAKKKRPAVTIDVSEDEDVVIELDGEIISKQKKSEEGIAAASSEHKKRARRRVKKHGSKSSEGEEDTRDDQDRSSPLRSRFPSAEPSSDELFLKAPAASKLSFKRTKPVYGRKRSYVRDKKSFMDTDNRMSSEDPLGLTTEYSEVPEQSTDLLDSTLLPLDLEQQGEELASSPQITDEPETFPFTPVECEWCLIGPGTLVCRHPVLGEIRSRPVAAAQSFYGWSSDRYTYNWRAFYDPEIYTVIEPFATETKTKRRREL